MRLHLRHDVGIRPCDAYFAVHARTDLPLAVQVIREVLEREKRNVDTLNKYLTQATMDMISLADENEQLEKENATLKAEVAAFQEARELGYE